MQYPGKPHVLVLGGNFAGLTTARFIREQCGKDVDITVIEQEQPEILKIAETLAGTSMPFFQGLSVHYSESHLFVSEIAAISTT